MSLQKYTVPLLAAAARIVRNTNLRKRGVRLKYGYVPRGMYSKPFIEDFSEKLLSMTKGEAEGFIEIDAVNSFTVGNFEKDEGAVLSDTANMLDPTSKFKDSWFGVYLVFDDECGRGRRFFLKEPKEDPTDPDNFNTRSMVRIPEVDQKLIVWTTEQGRRCYGWREYIREFHFLPTSERTACPVIDLRGQGRWTPRIDRKTNKQHALFKDHQGRKWKKVEGDYATLAACTDTTQTDMELLGSIRAFVGLPEPALYEYVKPWHEITIQGIVLARHFGPREGGFWAIVYFNGTKFERTNPATGEKETVSTWKSTDLQQVFDKMFRNLEIESLA